MSATCPSTWTATSIPTGSNTEIPRPLLRHYEADAPLTRGVRRLNSIMSLAATQQVCAAGALLAILQRDHVLSMAAPAARGSDDMDEDDRHTKALLLESLAEVFMSACMSTVSTPALRSMERFG